ncbi:response regulator transcription factor [Limnochorda pilosa]|uniref:Transcriptional regulator n=1 Tax=Limnochorda pilosa TaxID=1555112 RepID=A0A0K2SIV7_LIMPI|nr:response regulator transcription factor [Limnochorda pilosa]BAS27061.1 transcriptional regulator [Limnochorda pilosa]
MEPPCGHVLVVDDDEPTRRAVRIRLEKDGHEVTTASTGEEALECFRAARPDLVVLDLVLPDRDGFDLCRHMTADGRTPVIILTGRDDPVERTAAFHMGADDFVPKPFSLAELALRVQAILRRTLARCTPSTGNGASPAAIRLGPLAIDRIARTATLSGEELTLTCREFELLWLLASRPEQVFTRKQLAQLLWPCSEEATEENVTVLVSRLRKKVELDPSQPNLIRTVWGIGYRMSLPGTQRQVG